MEPFRDYPKYNLAEGAQEVPNIRHWLDYPTIEEENWEVEPTQEELGLKFPRNRLLHTPLDQSPPLAQLEKDLRSGRVKPTIASLERYKKLFNDHLENSNREHKAGQGETQHQKPTASPKAGETKEEPLRKQETSITIPENLL
jgi:hypothetical protein